MENNIINYHDLKEKLNQSNIDKVGTNFFMQEPCIYYQEKSGSENLYFTESYIKKNKEKVIELLMLIIPKYKNRVLEISNPELLDEQILIEIVKNPNIEEVVLGDLFHPYNLTEEAYNILKTGIKKIRSAGVSEELKYNFDEIIEYNQRKRLIGPYSYKMLQSDTLYISKKLDAETLEYLRCIGDKLVIKITNQTVNTFEIIKKIRKLGKKNKIIIIMKDKKRFNEELFKSNISFENIEIEELLKRYTLQEYYEYEKLLYSFVEPAKDFSPLEKYIYAYDIVKFFKKYKESKKDKMKSRRLYSILNNNYMVCVGYSIMLEDLLNKLEIPNIPISVSVELSSRKARKQLAKKYGAEWDKMSTEQKNKRINEQATFIPNSYAGHSRRMVYIQDPKYGIDGIYFSDPTWDNNIKRSYYNHLLMSVDDVLTSNEQFQLSDTAYELLYSTSIKNFNEILNAIIDSQYRKQQSSSKIITQEYIFENTIESLLQLLKQIDISFYNYLCTNYDFVEQGKLKCKNIHDIPENITMCLYDIAKYISSKNNKRVDGSIILEAVKNVYQDIYDGGLSDDILEEIRIANIARDDMKFSTNRFRK